MSWKKIVLIGFGGLVLLFLILSYVRGGDGGSQSMAFSDLISAAKDGKVERLNVGTYSARARFRDDPQTREVNIDTNVDLALILQNAGVPLDGKSASAVRISYSGSSGYGDWIAWLTSLAYAVIFALAMYYAVRNAVREGFKRASAASSSIAAMQDAPRPQ
jgi:hypothetical protein